jgi:putative flavoprotein involved in K+ transport
VPTSTATDHYDVAVIGGSQAGLAIGYFLAQQGADFVILDAADEPAAVWRRRWDSLTLFTSARYASLAGMPFPGDPDRYPTKDEVADYLTEYAQRFELPLKLDSAVRAVHVSDGRYLLELDDRVIEAEQVVIATGPYQTPFVPPIADGLGADVHQLHSTAYRSPAEIADGRVLVVGGGNTGYQIAEELAGSHDVHISIGTAQKPLPQRILGRDLFWYLDKTGLIRKDRDSRIGKRLQANEDTLIGYKPKTLEKLGVTFHPRALDAAGSTVTFSDDTKFDVGTVVWATGFRLDHSWVDAPVFDEAGKVIHTRGVTASPGLYFIGLPWQHTRGSSLIGFVKSDAEHLAGQIRARRAAGPALTTISAERRRA